MQDPPTCPLEQALGNVLRAEREAQGLTRLQVVRRLPSGIGDRTLLTYEHGIRSITVMRLDELGTALRVKASVLLERAELAVGFDPEETILVDLHNLAQADDERFGLVHQWARSTRDMGPTHGLFELQAQTVRTLAERMGVGHVDLAAYLVLYQPGRR